MADAFPASPESGLLAGLWSLVSGAFGAGVVWGATRSTSKDHGRRIQSLEENADRDRDTLADKIDANHREVMRHIVALAAKRSPVAE